MGVNNNPNNPLIYTTTGTPAQKANTAANDATQQQIKISRELDGVNDTGIVGELLTAGTENLSQANKYFSMSKFGVSGLLAEDNQAVSSTATVAKNANDTTTSIECADDMYVAGDPSVGGKGNNYQANDVTVQPGYYTMFEDGKDGGPKITVNSHAETINPEGKTAFTEYGFVVQGDDGTKTKATLSGGVLNIADANGQTRKLMPGETYTVGNASDPTAKFYYADVPGAGKDGATEKRLMVDYYEKPTQDAINQMVAKGVKPADAAAMRTKTTMSYGFRTPDGVDTYASSEGVGSGTALKTTANGVKTYYDAHYNEGSCSVYDVATCPPPPPPPPCEPPIGDNEHARIWGDPHIQDADGGKYDFQETGIYNVLTDKGSGGVELNAQMAQGPDKTTVMPQTGLTVGGRTVLIKADGTATIGYLDPNIKTAPVTLKNGQSMLLDNGATITSKDGIYKVETPEYKFQFDTTHQYKGYKYIDMDIWTKAGGVMSDGKAPSGLVGETFDADDIAQTKTKNSAASYKESALFDPNFKGAPVQTTYPATPTNNIPTPPIYTPPVNTTPTPPVYTPPVNTTPTPPVYTPPVNNTPTYPQTPTTPTNPYQATDFTSFFQQLMAMFAQFFGTNR